MNLERAILLTMLAAKGDPLYLADIRREVPQFTRQPATLSEIAFALDGLEERGHVTGIEGTREDERGNPLPAYTLTTKGRARALQPQ